jgi:hypothetical protein
MDNSAGGFGSFYNGTLDTYELSLNWNPLNILTFEFNGIRNIGELPYGNFRSIVGRWQS